MENSKSTKSKIVCVVGPTASGKTAFAIKLAKERNGEIVSCDSMQIYKYMDIGTAKPTKEEREEVPHHMYRRHFIKRKNACSLWRHRTLYRQYCKQY